MLIWNNLCVDLLFYERRFLFVLEIKALFLFWFLFDFRSHFGSAINWFVKIDYSIFSVLDFRSLELFQSWFKEVRRSIILWKKCFDEFIQRFPSWCGALIISKQVISMTKSLVSAKALYWWNIFKIPWNSFLCKINLVWEWSFVSARKLICSCLTTNRILQSLITSFYLLEISNLLKNLLVLLCVHDFFILLLN